MSTMGSSRLWGKITVLIALCGWCLSAQAKYDGGFGTEAEPYRISAVSDWQELMATSADWAAHFVLTADIDLNDVPITPVGDYTSPFAGVLDGNDYVIRNADMNMPSCSHVGPFGDLDFTGQIKNLGVENASISGKYQVGGLTGRNDGTVCNSYSTGSIIGTFDFVGGLVGCNGHYGTISNCYSTGRVTGKASQVGGLAGSNGGSISNCYSTGYVIGTGTYIGGLVGYNGSRAGGSYISNSYSTGPVTSTGNCVGGLVGRSAGAISNCYATNSVNGTMNFVGGLVGYNSYSAPINNCYSAGLVTGTGYQIGGLVGLNDRGDVSNSFWDVNTSGWATGDGGTPKTMVEMKTESTFTSAGWDFIEVWDIGEDQTYPFLRTYAAGDINHDGVLDFRDMAYLAGSWLRDVR